MATEIMEEKNSKLKLAENTLALMVIQVLNYILPFISLPYLARVLEVDKLGLIFFAQVAIDYFWRLVSFGFDFSGVQKIAKNRDNPKRLNLFFNSILGCQICLLGLSLLILIVLTLFVEKFKTDSIVYYFTFLSVIGNITLFSWFYQGQERMKFITIFNVITRTIALILIFLIIHKPQDYYFVPLLNSLGILIAGFVSILFLKNKFNIKFYIPPLKSILNELKYSSQFFIGRIGVSLYKQTNALALGLVLTTTSVAYFVSADKIFNGAFNLYFSLVAALFPFMTRNRDIKLYKKILMLVIIFSVITALILFFCAEPLILLFFSAKMLPAIGVLKILSISFVPVVLIGILGFPLLGAFNYMKETNQAYIIGGCLNLFGLVLLILLNKLNIYSTAIVLFATYMSMFIHRLYYINKYKLLKEGKNG